MSPSEEPDQGSIQHRQTTVFRAAGPLMNIRVEPLASSGAGSNCRFRTVGDCWAQRLPFTLLDTLDRRKCHIERGNIRSQGFDVLRRILDCLQIIEENPSNVQRGHNNAHDACADAERIGHFVKGCKEKLDELEGPRCLLLQGA